MRAKLSHSLKLIALGAVVTLAHAPFFLWPLAMIALFLFLPNWLAATSGKQAFVRSFWFFFGFFFAGTYWIAHALLVDAEQFALFVPIAVFLLAAGLSLFHSATAYIAWQVVETKFLRVMAFVFAWWIAEWLRISLFGGFPWLSSGYAAAVHPLILQTAALFGENGLSLLMLLLWVSPRLLYWPGEERGPRILAVLSILLLWIFSLSYGVNHLPKAPTPLVSDVHFRLVQPNIAQTLKWQPEVRERTLENLLSLSARPGWQKITHIVWPEAAIPYVVHPDDGLVRMLKETLPPSVSLITGAMRGDRFPENPEKIWNSLFVIRPQIGVDKFYDKHHLVPFGEFIPLRSFVPIKKLTFGDSDFSRGAGPENISIAGIGYISPLICFEVIFPENIVARQKARPQLLLNLTNDGWFAGSLQPYQHFAMARMRAVEQGLPLLRLSNIGISAMIDPYGRIVAKLPLNYAGVLDVDLPKADASATIFSVIGRAFALILIYFFGCFVIVIGVAKRQIVS